MAKHLQNTQVLVPNSTTAPDQGVVAHEDAKGTVPVAVAINKYTSHPMSTDELYTLLRQYASKGHVRKVDELVETLVRKRHEEPNAKIYAALILANIDCEHGSAERVKTLLDEMAEEGIILDHAVCNNILKVLAIHPDSMLRGQMLAEMTARWIPLSVNAWHDVVAGHIKEAQLELALEGLAEMRRAGMQVQGWLYDMTTFMLCQMSELDEACELTGFRISTGSNISFGAWYCLFDAACTVLHYDSLALIWARRVEARYLTPSAGHCLAVLTAAARAGDTALASSVFRILSERGSPFDLTHYELLVETYMSVGDVKTSFSVLCIMQAAGFPFNERSTRTITHYLGCARGRPEAARAQLQELQAEGRTIPVAAVNCLIEASVTLGSLRDAVAHYQQLRPLCADAKPNVATFNNLLRGCRAAGRKDTALFLAQEMRALGVAPNALTYDRLLLLCLQERDYEDAFRYYGEMRQQGWTPNAGTWIAMVHRCCEMGDARAWTMLSAMTAAGMSDAKTKEWLVRNWKDPEGERGDSAVAAIA